MGGIYCTGRRLIPAEEGGRRPFGYPRTSTALVARYLKSFVRVVVTFTTQNLVVICSMSKSPITCHGKTSLDVASSFWSLTFHSP
jgi:hypothetical protein